MIKILFLAANPRSTPELDLKAEADAIAAALRRARYGDHFQFITHYAARVSQLQELLLDHQPQVVHFSGHGAETGEIILACRAGSTMCATAIHGDCAGDCWPPTSPACGGSWQRIQTDRIRRGGAIRLSVLYPLRTTR